MHNTDVSGLIRILVPKDIGYHDAGKVAVIEMGEWSRKCKARFIEKIVPKGPKAEVQSALD